MIWAMLAWARPEIDQLDCNDCFRFLYNIDTGEVQKWRGKPAKRPTDVPPPCGKCPKQGPDKQTTLTVANRECVQHYLECRATGQFPDDPLVKRHAAILQMVEKEVEKIDRNQQVNIAAMQQSAAQMANMAKSMARKG